VCGDCIYIKHTLFVICIYIYDDAHRTSIFFKKKNSSVLCKKKKNASLLRTLCDYHNVIYHTHKHFYK